MLQFLPSAQWPALFRWYSKHVFSLNIIYLHIYFNILRCKPCITFKFCFLFLVLSGVQSLFKHTRGWPAAPPGLCHFVSSLTKKYHQNIQFFHRHLFFLSYEALHWIWPSCNGRGVRETFPGTGFFFSLCLLQFTVYIVWGLSQPFYWKQM